MSPIFAFININTSSIFCFGHSAGAKIDALIATTGVPAELIRSAHTLSALVHIHAFSASELIARLTPTVEAADGIETALLARAGFLTFVNILAIQPVRGSPKADPAVDHATIGADGVVTVLAGVAGMSTQSTLVDILTGSPICGDAEACGAGAVVGPHGVVAGVGARLPCRALVCIGTKRSKRIQAEPGWALIAAFSFGNRSMDFKSQCLL